MVWLIVLTGTMGGWVNQAYSRLSTTHGHITDCKLDSVVYAGVTGTMDSTVTSLICLIQRRLHLYQTTSNTLHNVQFPLEPRGGDYKCINGSNICPMLW